MSKPIVNIADVDLRDVGNGIGFVGRVARIGSLVGMKQLGCQFIVIEPGCTAFPFHAHHVNEEMFVVLAGSGTYRCGAERLALRAGDIVSALAGDGTSAHQIINTGNVELRYLAISTRINMDVVEYPDSGKFAVATNIPDGSGLLSASFKYIGRHDSAVDYYDGEG